MQDGRYSLPLIDIVAIAPAPLRGDEARHAGRDCLPDLLTDQQKANKVPDRDRVVIQIVTRPRGAEIFQPRSKTMPLVIFLAVMFATVGLAFLLENLRPLVRPGEPAAVALDDSAQRRTA